MIRNLLFALAFLFVGAKAQAEVVAAVGSNLTFEYAADGRTLETRQPIAVRGGYRFEPLDVYLEYQTFRAAQGTPMVFVSRDHQEWLVWARRLFLRQWKLQPYAALGAGFQYDRVETTFDSQINVENGSPQTLLAMAGGLRLTIMKQLDLQLETRAAHSPGYSPNPMLSFGLLVGLNF